MALNANAQGRVSGKFTIPANVPAGSKLIEVIGAGGNYGSASFVGRGVMTVNELRQVTTINRVADRIWRGDPLAQTFSLPEAAFLSGVDLFFTEVGATPVLVELRETTAGVPNSTVLAAVMKAPSDISLAGATRFSFPAIRLDANKEYALVVACNDADAAVAVAELGKYDATANRWVTSQPYQVGVLLSSSNASTWTPHQDRDLTFRLLTSKFSAPQQVVTLPAVTVTAATDLIVLAAVERPSAECDVRFELTLPGGETLTVSEGQPVSLTSAVTGNITWRAVLSGSAAASPRLYPDVQLVWGVRDASSEYVTRLITAGAASKISVTFEALTPGTSSVNVKAQDGAGWTDVPYQSGTPVGDGWVEVKRVLSGFNAADTRIKLILQGSSQARPRIRNLRVVVTAA